MKKSLLCVLMALLCGCTSLPVEVPGSNHTEPRELVLAVPENSDELLSEVARELARRTEDFAENSLSVEIVEVDNIWRCMEQAEADLLLCGNEQLLSDGALRENTALFAMMEEPYFFLEEKCIINGGNHEDILATLNHSLGEDFPMELRRVSYRGTYDLLCSDSSALEEALLQYTTEDIFVQYEEEGIVLPELWTQLLAQYGLQEIELGQDEIPAEGSVVFSGHRQKVLEFFVSEESLRFLTEKERAAVEEAIVYSGGYCRTLAESQRKYALQELKDSDVPAMELEQDDWYEALQRRYQSDSDDSKREFARLFENKVERFH